MELLQFKRNFTRVKYRHFYIHPLPPAPPPPTATTNRVVSLVLVQYCLRLLLLRTLFAECVCVCAVRVIQNRLVFAQTLH